MPYTVEQAREIMAETDRHLANDPRLAGVTAARASAKTDPPARTKSFHDVVVDHQKEGKTLPEATRAAAIERPDLREAYVKADNAHRELKDTVAKADARQFRNRNR